MNTRKLRVQKTIAYLESEKGRERRFKPRRALLNTNTLWKFSMKSAGAGRWQKGRRKEVYLQMCFIGRLGRKNYIFGGNYV